ncbi:unnamed protein product, partial [Allacma fusca]
MAKEVKGR